MKIFLRIVLVVFFLSAFNTVQAKEKWKEYKSRHFIIFYKNAPKDFIKNVKKSSENYYSQIVDDLGFMRDRIWTWDERVSIYIYDDDEDYISSSHQAHWSQGSTLLGSKVIRTFPSAHGFFDSVLPHELGHIIFREYVGFKSKIPLWVDEGVAMYQEKAKRWGANKSVRKAIENGSFLPLKKLSRVRLTNNSSRETVDLFYAEAASVIYYLISSLGKFKFSLFCRNLRKGLPFERALEKTYYRFETVDDLNKAWLNYLRNE